MVGELMRSQWLEWPDPVTIRWPVPGGTAHVVYRMFGGERVENNDGTQTPREFTYVEMPSDPAAPYFVMECEYSPVDLVPRIMTFQLIQRDPMREVRSTDLRHVHLEDALEQAWLKATIQPVRVKGNEASPADVASPAKTEQDKRKTLRGLRSQNRRKVTPNLNQKVAEIWLGDATGAPTKAVADHFDLAPSTASLYVKRARDAGLLPRMPPKKAAHAPKSSTGRGARPKNQTRSQKD
jgi:hypothetical protein